MTIKLRPYSETLKENMSKEDLIVWITELEPCVKEARSLRAKIAELEAEIVRMGNLVRNFTNVVEATAFSMAAPNPYTPKFIQLVCVTREALAKIAKEDV